MNRRLGICLLSLVAVTVVWGVLAVGAATPALGSDTSGEHASISQPLTTPDEFDDTLFRIRIYENQSAKWTFQHSRPLNESEEDEFEQFAANFRDTETRTYRNFQTRAENLVGYGENVTDRSMTATNFSRDAYVSQLGQTQGVVELSFVWTNFTRSDGDRIEAGDVFVGGMFIDEGQRLEFRTGPGLRFADVQPSPDSMAQPGSLADSDSVTWIGEVQFSDQRPYAVLESSDAGGPATGGVDGGEQPDQGDPGGILPMVLASLVVLLAVAGGVAWYTGRLPTGSGETAARSPSRGATGTVGGETRSPSGNGAAGAQVSEEELLSDEDRVLKLLDENGGRMKQVAIVEETDWSKSKVSMLLSDMEEEGDISKLRLGRENIISVAGQEPDAAGSPFEDE